ncbi:hypothetical protein D3C76_914450 [compost metagenome]
MLLSVASEGMAQWKTVQAGVAAPLYPGVNTPYGRRAEVGCSTHVLADFGGGISSRLQIKIDGVQNDERD